MSRVTNLSDKNKELRNKYHTGSNSIMMDRVTNLPNKYMYRELRKKYNDVRSNSIMMNRVTSLPDKYRELRKEYHKESNAIMMNTVTNLPDKYRELRKEYHKVSNTIIMN